MMVAILPSAISPKMFSKMLCWDCFSSSFPLLAEVHCLPCEGTLLAKTISALQRCWGEAGCWKRQTREDDPIMGVSSAPDLTAEESKAPGKDTALVTEPDGDKIFSSGIFPTRPGDLWHRE